MAARSFRPDLPARVFGAPFLEDWPIAMRLARLIQRKDFLAAAEHGRRFRSSAFTAQVRDAREDEPRTGLRLGLTASRKAGNAVERNRIRRRLRAAADLALAGQEGQPCDIVIVARPETLRADFGMLVADIAVAIDRARPPGKRRSPFVRSPS